MGSKVTRDIEPQKDLSGKVTIVTGPSLGGIGYYTAKAFAERGSTVILAGRDQQKLDEAATLIRKEVPNKGTVHTQILDVSDLESVETFAREFQQRGLPLHYLINNAGIFGTDADKTTRQGFELQIGTNHLGHFHLTNLLLPQLKAGAPSRIVNVSSKLHGQATFTTSTPEDFRKLFHPTIKEYSRIGQYGNSKLANLLHANVLNEQYSAQGITAYSLHPGVVSTGISRQTKFSRFVWWLGTVFMKSPDQGAATTMYCALTDEALKSAGGYFDDCASEEPSKAGKDILLARALWAHSEKLIAEWKANQQARS